MWPFTSRRIFANRWWALAFVGYVCWQAVDLVGSAPAGAANAQTSREEEQQMRDVANSLDSLNKM